VEDRNARLAETAQAGDLVSLGKQLVANLNAVEEAVHNPHAEVDYDVLAGRHGGAKLYSRLSWLFNTSGDHDGPPTQGMLEVATEIERELEQQEAVLDGLISADLVRLNERASELDLPFVMTPGPTGQ
jgi:hypothetical protein